MPFSIVITGFPQTELPVAHTQGALLQGMFLQLIREVDPAVNARLHDDVKYRPYTLSPLSVGQPHARAAEFRIPRGQTIRAQNPCYLRVTLLEDALFPTFSRYFLSRPEPCLRLGETTFHVSNVLVTEEQGNPWSVYRPYADLIAQAQRQTERRITLRFLTPTSFRQGDLDLPLPLPRLVFQGYLRRFQEFQHGVFTPDVGDRMEQQVSVSRIQDLRTEVIKIRNVLLIGFVGEVQFEIAKSAPPEFVAQMHLLADFAFFCGTGRKTTVGMGQTRRIQSK